MGAHAVMVNRTPWRPLKHEEQDPGIKGSEERLRGKETERERGGENLGK